MKYALARVAFAFALAGCHLAQASPPTAPRDLGSISTYGNNSTVANGWLFFNRGPDLWKSDGSVPGTVLVKAGVTLTNPVSVGSIVYFSNYTEAEGRELWRTDGTEAGTYLVKDLVPGPGDSAPDGLKAAGSFLYFHTYSPGAGASVYRSDGTSAGTVLLKEGLSSGPVAYIEVGGKVVFSADSLFVTDGSAAGTVKITDLASSVLAAVNGFALFEYGGELWRTDGTVPGTASVRPGAFMQTMAQFGTVVLRDAMLFNVRQNAAGFYALGRSDGTAEGTYELYDFCPDRECLFVSGEFAVAGGLAYFSSSTVEAGQELWVTDGTTSGTRMVLDIVPGGGSTAPRQVTAVRNSVYFISFQQPTRGLWRSNGTAAGTRYAPQLPSIEGLGLAASPKGLFASTNFELRFIPSQSASLDVDGSGTSDVLYRNDATGEVYRISMSGLAPISAAPVYREADLDWQPVGEGDFNGDGVVDLLWRHRVGGQVYVMPFTQSGAPTAGAIVHVEADAAWKIVATPDIDGDLKADILWWNSSSGAVWAMLMDGATVKAQGLVYSEPNTAWRIVAVGDFTASGKSNQLVWRNGVDGRVYMQTVARSDNAFTTSGQIIYTEPSQSWRIIGAADADFDGRSDLYWGNESTGQVYLMLMNGATIKQGRHIYAEPNLAWQIAAIGDYDGNGHADILYRNDVTGEVFMLLMNDFDVISSGTVYREPDTAWKVLGQSLAD